MVARKVTQQDFINTWDLSDTLEEAAVKTGLSKNYASVLASHIRSKGTKLKHMSRKKDGNKRLMTRTSQTEYEIWVKAAELEAQKLGLPVTKLTVGPWSRMILNRAAKDLGLQVETPTTSDNDNE